MKLILEKKLDFMLQLHLNNKLQNKKLFPVLQLSQQSEGKTCPTSDQSWGHPRKILNQAESFLRHKQKTLEPFSGEVPAGRKRPPLLYPRASPSLFRSAPDSGFRIRPAFRSPMRASSWNTSTSGGITFLRSLYPQSLTHTTLLLLDSIFRPLQLSDFNNSNCFSNNKSSTSNYYNRADIRVLLEACRSNLCCHQGLAVCGCWAWHRRNQNM